MITDNNEINSSPFNPLFEGKNTTLYSADEFQEGVLSEKFNDDDGSAILLIDGKPSTYNINIDRRCVTRADGSLITFLGILKMYDRESISILYTKKEKRFISPNQYREIKS